MIQDMSITLPGGPVGVLLIHGLGGTPVELKVVAKGLNKAGFTVHCCQLAGHCGTEEDLLATTWQDWFRSVETALDRLSESCTTVVAGGLSMGAIMALHLAARHPERVSGLTLFGPTLRYDGWSLPWYNFLLKVLIDTPIGRRFRFVESFPYGIKDERIRKIIHAAMESGNSAEAGLLGTPSLSIREFWRLVAVVEQELPTIRTRTLVVHAREDDIAGLSNAFTLQQRLGGLVDVLVLDDSYHLVTIDRQRDVLIARAVDFIHHLGFRPKHARPAAAAE
jgi:carboxylesterase